MSFLQGGRGRLKVSLQSKRGARTASQPVAGKTNPISLEENHGGRGYGNRVREKDVNGM